MKKIVLKDGKKALVDDEDFEKLNKYSWRSYYDGWNWYARRSTTVNKKCITILMHRDILGIINRNVYVDHKDRNGLNNQKCNLRPSSPSENKKNVKGRGTSKFLGVSLKTTKYNYKTKSGEERLSIYKRWEARIQHNKKQISIGFFNTETEAALAYDIKAKELHGEFSNPNFK